MPRVAKRPSGRKQRRTFSLAPDVTHFLKEFRAKIQAPSDTAALEALVREQKLRRDQEVLDAQISAFYDSLSEEELREEREWADFAASQLPHIEAWK